MVNIFLRMFKKMHMGKMANLIEKQSLSKKLDLATIPYLNNLALIFKHGTYTQYFLLKWGMEHYFNKLGSF